MNLIKFTTLKKIHQLMSMAQKQTVVIDSGSFRMKVGLTPSLSSSEEKEEFRMCFPATVGRPRLTGVMIGSKSEYFGDEAVSKRGMLKLTYPISKGIVSNWDDAEKIWKYSLDDLKRINEEIGKSVLMTDSPLNTLENREKMVEVLIEKLQVDELCLENQACLSIRASGRESGIVLDIGHTVTSIVPIINGKVLKEGIMSLDFGGHNLDQYFYRLMAEKGLIYSTVDWEMLRDIKERICFVSQDYESEIKAPTEKYYETPDGSMISLDGECIRCPEALFNPNAIENGWDCGSPSCLRDSPQFDPTTIQSSTGIHSAIYNSIMSCDEGVRNTLFNNIVLVGGSSQFKGISQRLTNELVKLNTGMGMSKVRPSSFRLYKLQLIPMAH